MVWRIFLSVLIGITFVKSILLFKFVFELIILYHIFRYYFLPVNLCNHVASQQYHSNNTTSFSAGQLMILIIEKDVFVYKINFGNIYLFKKTTLMEYFSIPDNSVKSAFTHFMNRNCVSDTEICVKSTIVVSNDLHYEIQWGKKVS